jgi:NHL repeat-containing protein
MRRALCIGLLLCWAACGVCVAQNEPAFVAKPSVATVDGKVRVRFEVNRAMDVTVAVIDGKGNVVRHLAAGMLGPNAPEPLQKDSLKQELLWDAKDDFGKDVPGGCSVRVGIGTRAKFGNVVFYEPGIAHAPRAVTVGPDGLLYVLMEHGRTKSTFLLQAFKKDGTYVRTVMPYPANLSDERLEGLARVKLAGGRSVPRVGLSNFRDLYPISTGMRPQSMPITSKGTIVLANASKTHNAGTRPQHLLFVSTDGGIPEGLNYIGPPGSSGKLAHGMCFVAFSPDEKWIYTSGHRKGSGNDDGLLPKLGGKTPPHAVVYRIGWKDTGFAKPFIGELYKPGNDETHLTRPRGIDTDAKGNIYVCDYDTNRVCVFDKDGKWVGKCEVEKPDQVAVDSKTGAIYVTTFKRTGWKKSESTLVKFAGVGKPAAYSVALGNSYPAMGLDTQGEKPVIWLARTFFNTWESPLPRRGVEKVVDLGDKFSAPVEVIKHRSLPDVYQIAASPVNDDVFVHSYSAHQFARVDGVTGEVKRLKIKGQDIAVGPGGEFYVTRMTSWRPGAKSIDRYDRDGKPLPFPGSDSNEIKGVPGNVYGHGATGTKGLFVSPRGDIAVIDKGPRRGVSIYGPDGKLKLKKVIDGLSGSDGSPVMDAHGNVYIGTVMRPADRPWPKVFGKKVPSATYGWMYGSVVKFPPAGGKFYLPPPRWRKPPAGTVWPPPDIDKCTVLATALFKKAYVRGAEWIRPSFSHIGGRGCHCYVGRFTVDWFSRVFIPDVGQFSVLVVDANNNEIIRFGDYGNEDSAGPGSAVSTPEIPLSWPYAVSVGKSGVYVSDFINRRIVRVDLGYVAEETCEIK